MLPRRASPSGLFLENRTPSNFQTGSEALLAVVAGVSDLRTAVRYAHPWFGPLDAAGWHALAAGHLGIHRVQIERIHRALRASGSEASAPR